MARCLLVKSEEPAHRLRAGGKADPGGRASELGLPERALSALRCWLTLVALSRSGHQQRADRPDHVADLLAVALGAAAARPLSSSSSSQPCCSMKNWVTCSCIGLGRAANSPASAPHRHTLSPPSMKAVKGSR